MKKISLKQRLPLIYLCIFRSFSICLYVYNKYSNKICGFITAVEKIIVIMHMLQLR